MIKIIGVLLFSVFALFACGVVEKEPTYSERYPYYCGNQEEHPIEKKYYRVIYELSDTLNKRNLPLHHDSTLVAHPTDSIKALGNYIRKIEFPDMWKEMDIQGASYYGIKVDEVGEIQTIEPLRVIYKNDLILPQLERYLLHLKFIEERYFNQVFILRILLRIDK
jgi:hypothetical protein